MDLRDKIGQRFVYRLPGITKLTKAVADFLVDCRAGGVVLFGYNSETPEQLAELNHDLQDLARRKGLPPFIIAVDEEGGQVSRMPARGQELIAPSPMAQAVAGPEAVRACSGVTARRLRRLGFNLNFAPSLDINNNPANPVIGTRSYGEDPQKVAELSTLAIEAYHNNGLSSCAKHFPGHGDTNVDSHFGLPIVRKSLEELLDFELVPFNKAIRAGVPAIMTAHILYPMVEKGGLPATFSRTFLTGLLREQMGFEGLIFTDALDMRAITDRYGLGKASLAALQAGADVTLTFSMVLEEQKRAFEEVVAAAEAGRIDLSGLDAALARLEKWRGAYCSSSNQPDTDKEDSQIIAQAARQSITIIKAENGFLPLKNRAAKRPLLVDFKVEMESPVEEGRLPGPILEQQLRLSWPALQRLEVSAAPTEAEAEQVRTLALRSDTLIVVTRNALRFKNQARLVRQLIAERSDQTRLVVVVAREPYDLALFEDAPVTIATYGDPPATMKALANLLTEE